MVVSKTPVWVHLANLPLHFWNYSVSKSIGNLQGKYLKTNVLQSEIGLFTYARVCMEIDLSEGLPVKGEKQWTQILDYENIGF